jgi:Holliday junction resolvase RusA-like endonuclease
MVRVIHASHRTGDSMRLIIPGEPIPKQRPRVTRNGAYTPAKTKNAEKEIQIMAQLETYAPIEGNVKMTVIAYFKIPKSKTVREKQLMREGKIRPTKRPDWDNIGKLVSDALNKITYNDDSQIVEAHVSKWYSDTPRTEIIVEGI